MTLSVPRSDLSPVERLGTLDADTRARAVALLTAGDYERLLSWHGLRRPSQTPPTDDDWFVWFYMAGRGAGKTRSAAEETVDRVEALSVELRGEYVRWAVIAPTFGDVRDIDVEGEAGLLAVLLRRGIDHEWNRSNGELTTARWLIQCYSAEKPDRVRGPGFHGAWLDEPGSFRFPRLLWDTLVPTLRLGARPRVLVTGTPKITWLIKLLVDSAKTNPRRFRMARSTTWRNRANLPDVLLEVLERSYAGTRLGRQELGGELLEEAEGAFWSLALLDDLRVTDTPELVRHVVAVDPAGSSGPDSDETGIIGAGVTAGRFPHAYVLGDMSGRWPPEVWARRSIDLAVSIGATTICAERNYGGDMVKRNIEAALRPDDPHIRVKLITAKKGKALRAAPVATYYETRRVHHLGVYGDLESQMVTWVQGEEETGQDSPDRVDALVYAVTELLGGPQVGGTVSVLTGSVNYH